MHRIFSYSNSEARKEKPNSFLRSYLTSWKQKRHGRSYLTLALILPAPDHVHDAGLHAPLDHASPQVIQPGGGVGEGPVDAVRVLSPGPQDLRCGADAR